MWKIIVNSSLFLGYVYQSSYRHLLTILEDRKLVTGQASSLTCLTTRILHLQKQAAPGELHQLLASLLRADTFPRTCVRRRGLLLGLVLEYCHLATNRRHLSHQVLEVLVTGGLAGSLAGLASFLARSCLQEAVLMEQQGDLVGFSLDKVDTAALSAAVELTVTAVLETGFSLQEAVRLYLGGRLIEVLRRQLKSLEEEQPLLLVRMIHDYIDWRVKEGGRPGLPLAQSHRHLLQSRVLQLLQDGSLVMSEHLQEVQVVRQEPRELREQLLPLTEQEMQEEEECREQDIKEAWAVAGQVTLSRRLLLPPRSAKVLLAPVSGLPRLQQGAALRLLPPSDGLQGAKVPAQEQQIELDHSVLVRLENRQVRGGCYSGTSVG